MKNTPYTSNSTKNQRDSNPDPLTGEPGSHPLGTGAGAASGSMAGAMIGVAAGGPVGGVVGAAVGGVVGGLAGKAAGEAVNPTDEEAFWKNEYPNRPYYNDTVAYDDISPAYRAGYLGYDRVGTNGQTFDQVESDLRRDYETRRTNSRVSWQQARPAAQDAWDRVRQNRPERRSRPGA